MMIEIAGIEVLLRKQEVSRSAKPIPDLAHPPFHECKKTFGIVEAVQQRVGDAAEFLVAREQLLVRFHERGSRFAQMALKRLLAAKRIGMGFTRLIRERRVSVGMIAAPPRRSCCEIAIHRHVTTRTNKNER